MEAYKQLFIENSRHLIDYCGKTVLELGCGRGDMLREIARDCRPRYIVGIDSGLGAWGTSPARGDNWEIAPGNAANLIYPDDFFDAVISVGVFEHLLDLKGTLAEIRRVLKPSGRLYTEFSPIWSSVNGHHYNFWIYEEAGLIPGWGHLWMSEEEMLAFLEPRIGRERAELACHDIYHGLHINRLPRRGYYEAFLNSGLWVRDLQEHISCSSRVLFGGRESELSPEICSRLRGRFQPHELAVMGFTLLLEKPAENFFRRGTPPGSFCASSRRWR